MQGVGFRPFVHRLAARHGLAGWVQNRLGRVVVHAEGPPAALARFGEALVREAPPLARPRIAESAEVPPQGMAGFRILASASDGEARVHLPPDRSVCEACLRELEDPRDRRHRYPFVNCTQCGPRYTIIERLPYDRARTSMARFALCADCAREYADPGDRRFHAEPLACPRCGPRLRWRGPGGAAEGEGALAAALACLRAGGIVAVRGVGGYHLLCDARSDAAVARLRARKRRPAKPLAVLFPDLAAVRRVARLDAAAAGALADPARPIVLVPLRPEAGLAAGIAPGLGEVGALLPYSPLHHLLARGFGAPLVATSGNVSGDPVVTDPEEAEALLGGVADGFLHHDRPIVRPADDPVLRPVAGAVRPLRLGRGTAPLELELPRALPEPVLATGGHMKATIALAWERRAVVSPHVGDLEAPRARALFERLAADL
ncbi:MAG TPA: carbamoyltransferase HypF, partial [Chromatiales bacterium]|nr:carbamoyltransferase HypF [Chromatiales bacterium]